MAARTPPRFVPTLTEVVRNPPGQGAQGAQGPASESATAPASAAPQVPFDEEALVNRVLQRVDLTLERRLREAVAATVLEHTRTLGPVLRGQIEEVVRSAVSQALADELGSAPPHQRR